MDDARFTIEDEARDDSLKSLSDPDRLAALAASAMMDSDIEPAFNRAVRLASQIIGVPVSLVSFVDDTRQFFKAQVGLQAPYAEERQTPLSHSFCQHVVEFDEPLMVSDAREDPLVAENGAIDDLGVIAYMGVPIHAPSGHALGSFCAIQDTPREWSDDNLAAMMDLVSMIEAELALRASVRERELVLQEMNHRVKNLFTIINSMVRLDRRYHETADELADSISARLTALSAAHEMIVPVVNAAQSTGVEASLKELLGKLVAPHAHGDGSRIVLEGPSVAVGAKAAVYVTLAVHELATNAAKYGALTETEGRLSISWTVEDGFVELDWAETGKSWDQLHTPATGFGSKLLRLSVEGQLGGTIVTNVTPDKFSHKIKLPLGALAE